MSIGQRIKYFRNKTNMTQAALSELAEMETANINRIENEKVIPAIESLLKICNALNITPNDLLLYDFNAPKTLLSDDIASLIEDCSKDECRKIIEFIYFIKFQRQCNLSNLYYKD